MKKRSFTGVVLFLLIFLLAAGAGVGIYLVFRGGGEVALPSLGQWVRAEPHKPPLEVIDQAQKKLLGFVGKNAGPAASDEAADLLKEIDAASARLAQDQQLDEAKLSEARRKILIARYAGAVIDRARFGKPLDDFAQQLISEYPNSALALQAEMLRLYARHDFRRPVGRGLAADIEKFAANHTPRQGAELYCMLAAELVRNRQPDAAKALVRRGIKAYQKTSPWVLSKLVNQSADLGLSKPPPPRFTPRAANQKPRSR